VAPRRRRSLAPMTLSKEQAEAAFESGTIRTTDKVRALALGVVAFSWAVLSADKGPVSAINLNHHSWILITAGMAVASLLIDLLHSIANYVQYDRLLDEIEATGAQSGDFERTSFLYRFAGFAFWAKVVVCAGSCLSLLTLVAVSV
jgi:hypothetical protein